MQSVKGDSCPFLPTEPERVSAEDANGYELEIDPDDLPLS
jgi:hypothetical protein